MFLAGKVGSILESRGIGFRREDTYKLRLAALLHDVGHGPFSHMFEEVLAYKNETTHEDMTSKIIMETEIGDIIKEFGFSRREMSFLSVGKAQIKNRRYMNDVIGGSLSVDLMDYLLRDSYFTGVEYGKVDVSRIINSFQVIHQRLAIEQAALFAFEALMIARYQMFRAVYFHRTVRAAELMIIRSMMLADKLLNLTDLSLDNYLALTDEVTLGRISTMETGNDRELKEAKRLALDYSSRNLLKCAFEKTVQRKDKFLASIFSDKSFREQFQQRIAEIAKVSPEQVFLDVPTAPSIPVSSSRKSLDEITLVGRGNNKGIEPYSIGIAELPLLGAISGYLDVVRVYTTEKCKKRVENASSKVFGREGFESRISM